PRTVPRPSHLKTGTKATATTRRTRTAKRGLSATEAPWGWAIQAKRSVAVGRITLERLQLGEHRIGVKLFVLLRTAGFVHATLQVGRAGAAIGGGQGFLGGEQHGAVIDFVGLAASGLGGSALDLE